MPKNVTQKLIDDHLTGGDPIPGKLIQLRIDQTLTQDATGTLVMLALEAMEIGQSQADVSVQYVDHNLIQEDHKNPDDHLFLQSAARRFGLWYSRPGNGVSHPLHMRFFGKPGATLLGSDSHTPAAGSLGMLAMGAGGLDVAMAMAGEPYAVRMPEIWGVRLVGDLPDWVSAKDVILEMLRRHGVDGGRGRVIEYHGPGLANLSAMDRHVLANMGTELGATSTVFPADEAVRNFLVDNGREGDFKEIVADPGATYDVEDEINLNTLEPLVAKPSSPGNVVPVSEVAGESIYQAYLGSSANPGFRDFAVPAAMVRAYGGVIPTGVSFDVNPASRVVLEQLATSGALLDLLDAGARLHQAGCNGCIGMGQAPATGRNSLRTVPRNFPGRSGTLEDSVFLCSPETATASALNGRITDPRALGIEPVKPEAVPKVKIDGKMFQPPLAVEEAGRVELVKGPNIMAIPDFEALPDELELSVLLKVGDDVSTDEILPAGAEVLPYRSNIAAIAEFVYSGVDPDYVVAAKRSKEQDQGHAIVGGKNYGQGSSREHAALAPRFLGLRVVLAQGFARIHQQNLINFGVVPLRFADSADADKIQPGEQLVLSGLNNAVANDERVSLQVRNGDSQEQRNVEALIDLTGREREVLQAGGLTNWCRAVGPCRD
ncbi:MAG TPA: aconitate hydratase [Alphaproteobacteria bacterium]|nr:aconitate hydratase [Alphaproteobacteria bacterium]